jgi:hypothetical protein
MGCNLKFKTKKLKLIHHHKMEPECESEKFSLIKLIRKFKETFKFLEKKTGIYLNSFAEYEQLKETYNETQKKVVDPDLFLSVLGVNFESECPNVENLENSEYSHSAPLENSLIKNEEEI